MLHTSAGKVTWKNLETVQLIAQWGVASSEWAEAFDQGGNILLSQEEFCAFSCKRKAPPTIRILEFLEF